MSSGPTTAFLISQLCLLPISSILKHVLHWVARSLPAASGLHLTVPAILIERFTFPKNFPKVLELTFHQPCLSHLFIRDQEDSLTGEAWVTYLPWKWGQGIQFYVGHLD